MTVSTIMWRKFDQDPKIRCGEPKEYTKDGAGRGLARI
jgi:hypothetical protein